MRERTRQTKRVRKFAFEWFLFITVRLLICHVSVILFKMGDNRKLLNGRGAKPLPLLYCRSYISLCDFDFFV